MPKGWLSSIHCENHGNATGLVILRRGDFPIMTQRVRPTGTEPLTEEYRVNLTHTVWDGRGELDVWFHEGDEIAILKSQEELIVDHPLFVDCKLVWRDATVS